MEFPSFHFLLMNYVLFKHIENFSFDKAINVSKKFSYFKNQKNLKLLKGYLYYNYSILKTLTNKHSIIFKKFCNFFYLFDFKYFKT